MPAEITVHVTQDDIDHGKAGDCTECPIALAVIRTFMAAMSSLNEVLAVDVTGKSVHILTTKTPRTAIWWRHSTDAEDFVRRFDGGLLGLARPFSFTVQIPMYHWFYDFTNTEATNDAVDRPEDR